MHYVVTDIYTPDAIATCFLIKYALEYHNHPTTVVLDDSKDWQTATDLEAAIVLATDAQHALALETYPGCTARISVPDLAEHFLWEMGDFYPVTETPKHAIPEAIRAILGFFKQPSNAYYKKVYTYACSLKPTVRSWTQFMQYSETGLGLVIDKTVDDLISLTDNIFASLTTTHSDITIGTGDTVSIVTMDVPVQLRELAAEYMLKLYPNKRVGFVVDTSPGYHVYALKSANPEADDELVERCNIRRNFSGFLTIAVKVNPTI